MVAEQLLEGGCDQVRREVGLTGGKNPLHEFLLGFVCYVMALPILAVGVLLTLLLMKLQGAFTGGDVQPPTHPIAESIGKANLIEILHDHRVAQEKARAAAPAPAAVAVAVAPAGVVTAK